MLDRPGLPQRWRRRQPRRYEPDDDDEADTPQCSDGADNDGDGVIDAADPGCHSDGDANNPASYVADDNDEGDGDVLGNDALPKTGGTVPVALGLGLLVAAGAVRAPPSPGNRLIRGRLVRHRTRFGGAPGHLLPFRGDPRAAATRSSMRSAPWRTASTRPATASTSSAGSCATSCSAGRSPADIDLTTDARPEQTTALVTGWADAVWDQGARFGTVGLKKGGTRLRDHHAPGRGLRRPTRASPRSSFADEVEADLSRRDFTVNAMALRVTGAEGGPGAHRPVRRRRRPRGRRAAHAALARRCPSATTRCACCRAARFLAGYGLEPDPELVAAVDALASRLEIVSAERIRDELDKLLVVDDPSAGLWFLVDTGLADLFLPELPGHAGRAGPDPPPQGRARPHDRGRRQDAAATLHRAPGRAAPRRRQAQDPLHRAQGRVASTTTRWSGARMARDRMRALRYSNDDVEAVTPARLPAPALPRLRRRRVDRRAPCAATCATPATLLDELNELTRCDCTTRNERKAEAAGARAWTSSRPASPSCASRRSWRPSGPTSTAGRSWPTSASAGPPWARPSSCSRPPRRGPLGEEEAYRASTSGGPLGVGRYDQRGRERGRIRDQSHPALAIVAAATLRGEWITARAPAGADGRQVEVPNPMGGARAAWAGTDLRVLDALLAGPDDEGGRARSACGRATARCGDRWSSAPARAPCRRGSWPGPAR